MQVRSAVLTLVSFSLEYWESADISEYSLRFSQLQCTVWQYSQLRRQFLMEVIMPKQHGLAVYEYVGLSWLTLMIITSADPYDACNYYLQSLRRQNIIPALYMFLIHVYVIEATSFIKRTMTNLHIAVEFYTHCSNKRHDYSAMDGYKCV